MADKTLFGEISRASFSPNIALTNAHIQTILPKFLIASPSIRYVRERVKTPDNDFLDLDWCLPPELKAVVVLFHGLEGSSQSHYIKHLVKSFESNGIGTVTMHFRGCSGEVNLKPISYHSGATYDPEFIIPFIKRRYTSIPLFAMGFSLGGNMLMKLVAKASNLGIHACACVSAPLNLSASSQAINQGFSKFYQDHLMKSMKANLLEKSQSIDLTDKVALTGEQIRKLKTFREFDEHITGPLHAFDGADDYYEKCSAIHDLIKIDTPTLIIHALDDPFMDDRVVPSQSQINKNIAYEYSQYGGHVGFLNSLAGQSKLWLPTRLLSFVLEQINH